MADEVLGHGRVGAARDAVALDDPVLHVRRRDGQLIAVDAARRESVPGVLRVLGRVRPAVHPDDAIVTPEHTLERVRDQRLRHRIVDLVDPHVRAGTAHEVLRRVRFRHLLGQREDGRVPARGFLADGLVDRQARVVAELGAGSAMRLIFVHAGGPLTPGMSTWGNAGTAANSTASIIRPPRQERRDIHGLRGGSGRQFYAVACLAADFLLYRLDRST